jgi:ABC-type lipoprotein export system ATPase subunit
MGKEAVPALCGVSLEIERGDFVRLMGPNGSGKTTLLNIIGGLDEPSRGLGFTSLLLTGLDIPNPTNQANDTRKRGPVFLPGILQPTPLANDRQLKDRAIAARFDPRGYFR